MPEGLLLRHQLHVVAARVFGQPAHELRGDAGGGGRGQRRLAVGENVLHVEAESVHLELGQGAHQRPHLLFGEHRAAADVHGEPAEAQRGPVRDGHARHAPAAHQLPQRLDAVEHPRRVGARYQHAFRRRVEQVALGLGERRAVELAPGNLALDGGLPRPADQNGRAAPRLPAELLRREAVLRGGGDHAHRPRRHVARSAPRRAGLGYQGQGAGQDQGKHVRFTFSAPGSARCPGGASPNCTACPGCRACRCRPGPRSSIRGCRTRGSPP